MICRICGASAWTPVIEVEDVRFRTTERAFPIVRCEDCGVLATRDGEDYVDPAPFYPPGYGAFVEEPVPAGSALPRRSHLRGFPHAATGRGSWQARVDRSPGRRVLDVGCGSGKHAAHLRDSFGWTLVGIEPNAQGVAALQGRGYREVKGTAPADVLVVLGAASRTTLSAAVEEDLSRHINPVDTSVFDASSRDTPNDASESRPPGIGREGDLILYLLDPATQRSLWRASSSGAASTPGEALRKARSAYRGMVSKLPMAKD